LTSFFSGVNFKKIIFIDKDLLKKCPFLKVFVNKIKKRKRRRQ